jgi:hypothetical protein
MKMVRNTVEDVKFTYFIIASFVRTTKCHKEFPLQLERTRKNKAKYTLTT